MHIQTCHIQNPGLFKLEASSIACRTYKITMHYSETGIAKSLFKHFQGYLGIFGDTDTYSATHRHTTRGQGESGGKGGKGGKGGERGERGGERGDLSYPF